MLRNKVRKEIEELVNNVGLPPYLYTDPDRFVAGQTPILYSGMYWDKEEIINGIESFLTGNWVASGENVKKFEKKFAYKIRDYHGVMVNSGSSANLILVASVKEYRSWEDGSEVIVSPVGFPTTISPISQNNLEPVFIDIEMDTLNFDVEKIEEKITPDTVAIFLSPVLGNPPDMDKIVEICQKNEIDLILDSCDSLGSKWHGKYLTEYALASSHSLYASHTLSTGEGGMITTSNPEIARIARQLIAWGRSCWCSSSKAMSKNGACGKRFDKWLENYDGTVDHKYVFDLMGFNLKPLDMQGAIGLAQMKKIDDIFARRIYSKNTIDYLFNKYVDGVRIPQPLKNSEPVWFGTPIICESKELKTSLVNHLETNLIQTRNYFSGNILLHKGYEHLGGWRNYPNANKVLDLVFFVGSAPFYAGKHFFYFEKVLKGVRSMNDILILGDGLLGSEIHSIMGWNYISRKKDGMDFNNLNSYISFLDGYSVILNCIAYTNTYSEERTLHWKTNYESVMDLVGIVNKYQQKLVHISTDYIYGGSQEFASEEDVPVHAGNWYSYTKLLSDAHIQATCNEYLLIRTSFKSKPFSYSKAIVTQVGNFDYVDVISELIVDLIEKGASGVFNVGTQMKSMYDLAIKTNPDIKPSDEKIHETMPEDISMNIDKMTAFLEEND